MYEVYDIPQSLQWVIGNFYPTIGEVLFKRHRKRLLLMARTLVHGMTQLSGTYPVWSIWGAFREEVGRDTIADWGRLFQAQGILTMPKWENKPRVINMQEAKRFIDLVQRWAESKPRKI